MVRSKASPRSSCRQPSNYGDLARRVGVEMYERFRTIPRQTTTRNQRIATPSSTSPIGCRLTLVAALNLLYLVRYAGITGTVVFRSLITSRWHRSLEEKEAKLSEKSKAPSVHTKANCRQFVPCTNIDPSPRAYSASLPVQLQFYRCVKSRFVFAFFNKTT